MASMGGFDLGFGGIPPNVADVFAGSIAMDGDEYVRCTKCGYGGCDVRVAGCGCTLHARCLELNPSGALACCPTCGKHTQGLVLFPMSFREIDEAHRTTCALPPSKGRGRKRRNSADAMEEKNPCISERRTGRWTPEEMAYCDLLMLKFENGRLPVAEGVKLNEFLGNMLKSKQSRLTKKMKNAKLSTKMFQRRGGCLDVNEALEFSRLEDSFFQAVTDLQEKAEIKLHMQKEWREQLSRVCAAIGQPLDADSWLSSVEEMDRRASKAKDAARMKKRKLMMGMALQADTRNLEQGVFIEKTDAENRAFSAIEAGGNDKDFENEMLGMMDNQSVIAIDATERSSLLHSAPFLAKIITYLQRHSVPFEHVDLWVPSFVPSESQGGDQTSCRLCYAGNATVEKLLTEDGKTHRALTSDEQFNFFAFGDYSQKFSFDVGCGLPGRVYESGRPTWEQSVHNAPDHHFERCGGAGQWGIKTVVGIPIASPNVGRIVVTLYSCNDRPKDEDLVARLSEEFTRLMPSPKWKLVVDIGNVEEAPPVAVATATVASTATEASYDVKDTADISFQNGTQSASASVSGPVSSDGRDSRVSEVVALLGKFMPSDPLSPHAAYVSGFMSLRLLMLRQSRTMEEEELVKTMLDSYSSYNAGGRDGSDIAVMLARDFLFLSQQQQQVQQQVQQAQQVQQLQHHHMQHQQVQQQQQHHQMQFQQQQQQQQQQYLGMNQNMMSNQNVAAAAPAASNNGLSLFGQPSIRSSLQNSPALTPIPAPGSIDGLSIVSN